MIPAIIATVILLALICAGWWLIIMAIEGAARNSADAQPWGDIVSVPKELRGATLKNRGERASEQAARARSHCHSHHDGSATTL